jgi:hypothetical protein
MTPEPRPLLTLGDFAGHELVIEPTAGLGLLRLRDPPWSFILLDSAAHDDALSLVERIAAIQHRVVLLDRSPSVDSTVDALDRGAWEVLAYPPVAGQVRDLFARCSAIDGPGSPTRIGTTTGVRRSSARSRPLHASRAAPRQFSFRARAVRGRSSSLASFTSEAIARQDPSWP